MVTEINLGMEEEEKQEVKPKKRDVQKNITEKIDISKKISLLEEKIAELEKCILEMASQLKFNNKKVEVDEPKEEKEEYLDLTKTNLPISPNVTTGILDSSDGEDKSIFEEKVLSHQSSPSKKPSSMRYFKTTLVAIGILIVSVLETIALHFIGINYFLSGVMSLITMIIALSVYLLSNKTTSVSKPNVEFQDFHMAEMTYCPKCNMKLKKSKVISDFNGTMQYFKCNNISCDFQKTIKFPNSNPAVI